MKTFLQFRSQPELKLSATKYHTEVSESSTSCLVATAVEYRQTKRHASSPCQRVSCECRLLEIQECIISFSGRASSELSQPPPSTSRAANRSDRRVKGGIPSRVRVGQSSRRRKLLFSLLIDLKLAGGRRVDARWRRPSERAPWQACSPSQTGEHSDRQTGVGRSAGWQCCDPYPLSKARPDGT